MGSQTPSVRIVPEYDYTDGADAVRILAVGKLVVDPWQSEVLNDWMGRTNEDIWSAPTCGLSVPRQKWKDTGHFRTNSIWNGHVFGMGDLYSTSSEDGNRDFYGIERIV